jgi:hypothetical protein
MDSHQVVMFNDTRVLYSMFFFIIMYEGSSNQLIIGESFFICELGHMFL